MADQQYPAQEEDHVGYWDTNGEYQYYEQQPQQHTQEEQWYGNGSSAPSSPSHQQQQSQQHHYGGSPTPSQWEIAYDDDNNPYYFNHTTSEWQYELPVDYTDPYAVDATDATAVASPTHEELGYWDEHGEYVYYETTASATTDYLNDSQTVVDGDGIVGDTSTFTNSEGWQAVDDGYGNVYYYNNHTQEQQWDAPETYTSELNAQAWYNKSVETAAVAFQGTDHEAAAVIRIQSLFRRRAANRRVVRKRELHGSVKALHASAVGKTPDVELGVVGGEQGPQEHNAAVKLQTLLRQRTAKKRANDLRALVPVLTRVQDCVEAHATLYGSPIASIQDLFAKIDQDGDGVVRSFCVFLLTIVWGKYFDTPSTVLMFVFFCMFLFWLFSPLVVLLYVLSRSPRPTSARRWGRWRSG